VIARGSNVRCPPSCRRDSLKYSNPMKKYVIKRHEDSFPDRLTRYREELNSEQFRVATANPGAALVVAGAGTGKTRTITYRVAYLIEQGVSPHRILLATFTNRAAREMLRRVETLTNSQSVHRVWGGTFHRVANLILRRHAVSIGYDSNYSILDSEDAKDLLSACIAEAAIDTKATRFPKAEVVQDIISYANNTDTPINDVIINRYPYFEKVSTHVQQIDYVFRDRKRNRNAMDYDDLLLNWKRLLIEKPEISAKYEDQFQHILVDEYQDTNKLQAELIDLTAARHRNVMVVGDDAQSIFAWRGAEFTNIWEFPKRYPEAATYKLETNYRSTPEILGLANTSIAGNRRQFPKILEAVKKSNGFLPALIPCGDVEQQSAFIASRVLELRDEGISLEEIGVLYRSHYHSLELQLELTRRNIPYRVQSGVRFFEQAHIKDVIAYLRILCNPRDEIAWKRVLKMIPSIGNAMANKIYEYLNAADNPILLIGSTRNSGSESDTKFVSESPDPAQLVGSVLPISAALRKKTSWQEFAALVEALAADDVRSHPARQIELILSRFYEQHAQETFENAEARLEDIRQLALYASRYDSTERFLSELALLSTERFKEPQSLVSEDVIAGGEEDELLTLTSVHQAKGLEWKVVFLIWAAEGKFPSPRSLKETEGEEEERRLWYVAVTRAKDELYITYPLMVVDYNRQTVLQKPSRFITECPPAMFEIWSLADDLPEPEEVPLKGQLGEGDFIN
jgi:DNA helicase II / ATP-dependent DNA helicase PcrA